jgi:hypothetical protein
MDNGKKRGGARPGAGRPAKPPNEIVRRKQRQLRAFDDEWEIINRFAWLVKHGNKEKCKMVLDELEKERMKMKSKEILKKLVEEGYIGEEDISYGKFGYWDNIP